MEEENASLEQQQQQQQQQSSRELGKITVVKNGFGFIKCEERVEDVFFHFTQLKNFENPKVGKIVQFTVHRDQKRDTLVAHDVCEAPEGTKVVFETVDERSVRGVCKERWSLCLGDSASRRFRPIRAMSEQLSSKADETRKVINIKLSSIETAIPNPEIWFLFASPPIRETRVISLRLK